MPNTWRSTSSRWTCSNTKYSSVVSGGQNQNYCQQNSSLHQMEGFSNNGLVMRKRVMVVVDQSSWSKHAMMFALSHVVNKSDLLTLLHVVDLDSIHGGSGDSCSPFLLNSLASLCKACKPEVEVEALVVQGPKLSTVMSQVKKLEVSVLVLGQKKPSYLFNCLCVSSSSEEFVEDCIKSVECMTIGVRKQSKGVSGYLINTKWQKNFWLLA